MAVNNNSGRDVEYEVQPSNPGLGGPIGLSAALTAVGGGLTAYGCLADEGTLTAVGLFLLVAALLADLYAYNKAQGVVVAGTGGGKALLADGASVEHAFAAGTWVVFTEVGKPSKVLGSSPPIFQQEASVTLRRCAPSAAFTLDQPGEDHVTVDPVNAGAFA
jgi:hypothetical protein